MFKDDGNLRLFFILDLCSFKDKTVVFQPISFCL